MMFVVLLFFGGYLFVVVVFVCCYVVKLAKAINTNSKTTPKKGGRTSVHFEHGQICLHVQRLLFFWVGLGCFCIFGPKPL